jgi:hypothetical protein
MHFSSPRWSTFNPAQVVRFSSGLDTVIEFGESVSASARAAKVSTTAISACAKRDSQFALQLRGARAQRSPSR